MIEIVAALLTLLCVWLAGRQSIWNWPVGIVAVCLFFAVFWQAKLYAAAALQVVFFFQSAWGWWMWRQVPDEGVKRLPVREWYPSIMTVICLPAPLCPLLYYHGSPAPILDTATFALSLFATYLLTYRYLETWIVWGITNVLYAGLFLSQGLYATAALSLVLIGLNRIAYLSWLKSVSR